MSNNLAGGAVGWDRPIALLRVAEVGIGDAVHVLHIVVIGGGLAAFEDVEHIRNQPQAAPAEPEGVVQWVSLMKSVVTPIPREPIQ